MNTFERKSGVNETKMRKKTAPGKCRNWPIAFILGGSCQKCHLVSICFKKITVRRRGSILLYCQKSIPAMIFSEVNFFLKAVTVPFGKSDSLTAESSSSLIYVAPSVCIALYSEHNIVQVRSPKSLQSREATVGGVRETSKCTREKCSLDTSVIKLWEPF